MFPTTLSTVFILASLAVSFTATLVCVALTYTVVRKARRNLPTTQHIQRLQIDIQDCYGRLEDLSERFTRFQKREGLRVAREEKKSQADLLEEARQIQARATSDIENKSVHSKADLYRRAFRQ